MATGLESSGTPEAAAARGDSPGNDAAGAGAVAVLGGARFLWAAWPLHPLGILTMASYPTGQIWFSVMLGWLLKLLVMRYGGSGLYRRLKPVAIGLITGEALAAGGSMLFTVMANEFFGWGLSAYRALPG